VSDYYLAVANIFFNTSLRRTVRGAKIEQLRGSLGKNYPDLQLVQVDDIATVDLTDALDGETLTGIL
jgi:hypothetical protein